MQALLSFTHLQLAQVPDLLHLQHAIWSGLEDKIKTNAAIGLNRQKAVVRWLSIRCPSCLSFSSGYPSNPIISAIPTSPTISAIRTIHTVSAKLVKRNSRSPTMNQKERFLDIMATKTTAFDQRLRQALANPRH